MLRTSTVTTRARTARVVPASPFDLITKPSRSFSSSSTSNKQQLVILGSGWGGYELLRKVDRRRYDVTVVSPNSYFAFTPLLAGAAVGTVDYNSTLEPVRAFPDARYYQAWADKIDFANKRLTAMPATGSALRKRLNAETTDESSEALKPATSFPGFKPFELKYDKLVIAVGCYSATFGIPGVSAHAYFLKDVRDAAKIRQRILECFELACQPTVTDDERRNLLNFVIVGGGPTGVEFAGELHDFLTSDLTRAYPQVVDLCKISIYDVAPGILGSFDKSLQEYAEDKYVRRGIAIKGNRHVESVDEGVLHVKEEGAVKFGLAVWSTGLAANPLIDSISELDKDDKTHSLRINDSFNPSTKDGKVVSDVYCIGDASALENKLPPTAQVASQEAAWLARILNAEVKQRAPPGAFKFNNQGTMAYLGEWTAIVDRSKADGPQGELTGRAAWLLWRSAYLYKSMSLRNMVSLSYHWAMSAIAGRRLSRF
ncbi:hypothetical protein JCM3775_002818 [Rhodotorula graminis]|uniref:NADH:ubiquinone reductase (non-electrogenic) n=1 Tax=Rhodotorula graminis (strain WP1) TaxID=578459 RepID=A0A0P9GHG8_RHOGW|nr:uncharacterized protein RHOBADRAFT_55858 [Rhodotorula graminis WP1]KPV72388.1 hypothetical protein RHOBADRAFT_55858 [Rhodotorula graminis WP1]